MTTDIQQFLLILIRLTVFITVSPGFSHKSFPTASKLALAVGLTLPIVGTVEGFGAELTLIMFLIVAVKEVLIGLALGYITLLFFTTFEIAGAFVDFQVGFSMGQIYDPALGVNASFYGRIYYWISMMIFFIADIHHHVIRSLVNSFEWAPLELLSFNHFGMKGIMHLFSQMFQTAVQLAIPLIIVAILSELTLALISRTVPQINVLILGMPMKILVSMIFMFFFLSLLMQNISEVFPDMIRAMNEWLYGLNT